MTLMFHVFIFNIDCLNLVTPIMNYDRLIIDNKITLCLLFIIIFVLKFPVSIEIDLWSVLTLLKGVLSPRKKFMVKPVRTGVC